MSIFLTQIGSDNFNRAPENPLSQSGKWAIDSAGNVGLQIVSAGICENAGTAFEPCGELYSGVPLPNDQYASATFAAAPTEYGEMDIYVRLTDNGASFGSLPSYQLQVDNTGGSGYVWALYSKFTSLGSGSITIHAGDVFTLAVVGTTVYAYQNSTLLISVTNATYSSGIAALEQRWYTSSPSECQVSNWVVGSASLTPPATAGPTATLNSDSTYRPRPVVIHGAISSGTYAGEIAAVSCDMNGNLSVAGSGEIWSIDLLGDLSSAVPCMLYGPVSGSTVPGSTQLVAAACDQFGNLLTTESNPATSGNPNTTVDTPLACSTGVSAVQLFGRAPDGFLIGICAGTAGQLGNTLNPILNVPAGGPSGIDELSTEDGELPVPIILCARVVPGFSNSGQIVPIALDAQGSLCLSGAPGASTTQPTITFKNGVCCLIQAYARTSAGVLTSIPLTSGTGLLYLN